MVSRRHSGLVVLVAVAALAFSAPHAAAQLDLGLGNAGSAESQGEKDTGVEVEAHFTADASGKGTLVVKTTIDEDWHIYGPEQPKPFNATKVHVDGGPQYEVTGPFRPDKEPKVHFDEILEAKLHELEGTVTWTAPLKLASGADPESLKIEGYVFAQACNDSVGCKMPSKNPFTATYRGGATGSAATTAEATGQQGEFRPEKSPLTIRGQVTPAVAAPGERVRLTLTVLPDEGWWVYQRADKLEKPSERPVLIALKDAAGWRYTRPEPSVEPTEKVTEIPGLDPIVKQVHAEPVSWTVELAVPEDAEPGERTLEGIIGFQACDKNGCLPGEAASFTASVEVGSETSRGGAPIRFSAASYKQAANVAEATVTVPVELGDAQESSRGVPATGLDLDNLQAESSSSTDGLPMAVILLTAFAAGLILNVMPCVLPVIGLKVLAFVEQAGDSRGQVFLLNVWYSLGLMSVFIVLATLATFLGLGWGEQFSSVTFNVILASVVFVFALSFLGVWEIPIPGFVGSGKANELAQKEGAAGAFSKGVLTTVLATPCSGPMLGPAITWAVSQPPAITYAAFGCVGLGMASPYLLIGAFPKLVGFLPKPGAWMDTFKQLMGFVLLGTVVFLLTFIKIAWIVPTVAFMMGLWAACWWIGKTPLTESLDKKLSAWIAAGAFATVIGLFSFGWLQDVMSSRFQQAVDRELAERTRIAAENGETPRSAVSAASNINNKSKSEHELPWRPYSPELLQKLVNEGKTVFVDFTAHW